MNHRFHYESERQAQLWLALHEAYSPARTDDDCQKTYQRAFQEVAESIAESEMAVISIGCGGGQKDRTLLSEFKASQLHYVPSDVSLPLALHAHLGVKDIASHPALLDLPKTTDLGAFLDPMIPKTARRIVAFFGMLPNFEPAEALPPLAAALRANDLLLVSANLAPGPDYEAGVRKILPLYDNELTRRWLIAVLVDVGLDVAPEDLEFSIAPANDLLRIEANYRFKKAQTVRLDGETFAFKSGETFRLFFSYRHTPELLRGLLAAYEIEIQKQWITASGEEGVFLARKST